MNFSLTMIGLMMADKIIFKISGIEKVRKLLTRYVKPARIKAALFSIGAYIDRKKEETFRKSGARDGHALWKRLKPATIRIKRQTGKFNPLINTAQLKNSFTIRKVTSEFVEYGSNLIYAAIHQFGGTINHPGGTPYIVTDRGAIWLKKDGSYPANVRFTKPHPITIPAREMLFITRSDEKAIAEKYRAVVFR